MVVRSSKAEVCEREGITSARPLGLHVGSHARDVNLNNKRVRPNSKKPNMASAAGRAVVVICWPSGSLLLLGVSHMQ